MWMRRLFPLVRPALFQMDPEDAHHFTLKALKSPLFAYGKAPAAPAPLRVRLWGQEFPNPIGLAAGFDKNAEVIGPMLRLGFGFVEVGTITVKPQEGNPRPRVFRHLRTGSIINRMGFPGKGVRVAKENLDAFHAKRPRPAGIVGVNIGMNKDQTEPLKDYVLLLHHLGGLADYVTINISSPNTPGLRDLQHEDSLRALLEGVLNERAKTFRINPPPLLVKLSPDLEEVHVDPISRLVLDLKIDGLILTNTTLARPSPLRGPFAEQKGGLSGPLLRESSTAMIRRFYQATNGAIPIVGVGGVSSAQDAFEKIQAGASLVQLYTALVYHGPTLLESIHRGLAILLEKNGFTSIQQAVGTDPALRRAA